MELGNGFFLLLFILLILPVISFSLIGRGTSRDGMLGLHGQDLPPLSYPASWVQPALGVHAPNGQELNNFKRLPT